VPITVPVDGTVIDVPTFGKPVADQLNANTAAIAALGTWTAFMPIVRFGSTTASIANDSRFVRTGKTVTCHLKFRLVNLNGGTGALSVLRPAAGRPADAAATVAYDEAFGPATAFDLSGGVIFTAVVSSNLVDASDVVFRSSASPAVQWTHAAPMAWAAGALNTGDQLAATFTYETP
jgi:hypothetical protein